MPFCPNCRDEFQDWVKFCPDCEAALVDKIPALPKPISHTEPIVHISTAPNEAIAYMWAGILENHGIYCLCRSSNLRAAMYSMLINQHYTIYVLKSSAQRAKRLLTPYENSLKAYVYSRGNYLPLSTRIFNVILCILWLIG